MKKIVLLVCCLLLVTSCGITKGSLKKRITKENLQFTYEKKNICGTKLKVQNKLVLSNKKNDKGLYIGNFELYDCGDDAIYMTNSEGSYKLEKYKILFYDENDNVITFEIKSNDEVIKLDDNNKEVMTLKLHKLTK